VPPFKKFTSFVNDLALPSVAMATKARHPTNEFGGKIPAGILIYGKPNKDKELL
jgi:hypothetical protein